MDCVDEHNAETCSLLLKTAMDLLEALIYFSNVASDWSGSVRKNYIKPAYRKVDAAIALAIRPEKL